MFSLHVCLLQLNSVIQLFPIVCVFIVHIVYLYDCTTDPGVYYPLKAHILFYNYLSLFHPFSVTEEILLRLTKYSSEFQKHSASLRRSPRKKSTQKATQRSVLMENSETDDDTTLILSKVNTKFNLINLQGKSFCMCTSTTLLYSFIDIKNYSIIKILLFM